MQRPSVSVQRLTKEEKPTTVELPAVFLSPIRVDIVNTVHFNLAKNHRQAYAVARNAGEQTSAESWGTGRAVSRIPRVSGGGTHRAGQGAFGNMCRGGRMFAPTKVWRRWHRRVNKNQRRFAVASAVAASAVPSLVMARGHRVSAVPELPLVISNQDLANVTKTKQAFNILKALHADEDVQKVKDSRAIRAGKGKARNRRYVQRRGPLVVYDNEKITHAFRNIAGVELISVHRLNLLQLAPGGHVGRFIIWTEGAFNALDKVFGKPGSPSQEKSGFTLPRSVVTHADVSRIINSVEVQSHLRGKKTNRVAVQKKNPLTNKEALVKLNPYAISQKRRAIKARNASIAKRQAVIEARRAGKPNPQAEAIKKARKERKAIKKSHAQYINTVINGTN